MNRRGLLKAAGGGLAFLAGGTIAAEAARADITADPALFRGRGAPISTRATITQGTIEYVEGTHEVRWADTTEPFERWARRKCASVGSTAVLPAVDERLEQPMKGIGKGVRGLFFGLAITVDHTIWRDEDGSVMRRPNVAFDELVAVTPRDVNATVVLDGHPYTRDVPVLAQRAEYQQLGTPDLADYQGVGTPGR